MTQVHQRYIIIDRTDDEMSVKRCEVHTLRRALVSTEQRCKLSGTRRIAGSVAITRGAPHTMRSGEPLLMSTNAPTAYPPESLVASTEASANARGVS